MKYRWHKNLYIAFLHLLLLTGISQAQPSAHRLVITPLTDQFFIYTTYGIAGNQPYPANGMYLVTPKGAVLFDTPWDSTQFQPLLDSIATKHHQKVILCISTHSHDDRTAGLEFYRKSGIATFASAMTDSICRVRGNKRPEFRIYKDSLFRVINYDFETIYPGPGHSGDNIVIWFKHQRILYGGCFIKSTEAADLGNLSDANVNSWETAIELVMQKCKDVQYVIPGHLGWTDKLSLEHTLDLVKEYKKKNKP